MRAPEIPYGDNPIKNQIRVFSGLNRRPSAKDGEATDTRNISTDDYPALRPRMGRARYGTWENVDDVYECNGSIYIVADGKLFKDGEQIADVQPGRKQWGLVSNKLVIWPDKVYVNINTGEVRAIAASLTSSAIINDKNAIVISGSATNRGSIKVEDFVTISYEGDRETGIEEDKRYFRLYDSLSFYNGTWTKGRDRVTDVPFEGAYFAGSYPETLWYDTAPNAFKQPGGDGVYGKITKVTENVETGEYYEPFTSPAIWSQWTWTKYEIEYEVYGSNNGFSTIFEEDDVVKVSGSTLKMNNRYHKLVDLTGNGATIETWVTSANYLDVPDDSYPIGVYKVGSTYFNVTRKPRPGEQFVLSGGVLYLYNSDTEELVQFDKISGGTTAVTMVLNSYSSSTAEELTLVRECPEMEYICAHNNRIFGVSNNEESSVYNPLTGQVEKVKSRVLHASELGFPTRWNTFQGTAADSYSVAIGGNGDFTGICEYSGAVLAFKEDKMYRLTGDYPAEYYLRDYSVEGIKKGCNDSAVVINETLYYLSPRGVMAYAGGVPTIISYPLGMGSNVRAVAGRDRVHYFLCVHRVAGNHDFHRYDTVHGLWTLEGTDHVNAMCRLGDRMLMVTGGQIYETDSGEEETVQWSATLAECDEAIFEKKRYRWIRLIADVQGTLKLEYKANDNEWQVLGEIRDNPGKHVYAFAADTIRADRMTLRLSGSGDSKVYAIEREFTVGSDR